MGETENLGTFNLASETLVIVKEFGIRNFSVVLVSGTVTVKGLLKMGSRSSDAYVLTATPLNISFDFPIDGVTIDASAGAATLFAGK